MVGYFVNWDFFQRTQAYFSRGVWFGNLKNLTKTSRCKELPDSMSPVRWWRTMCSGQDFSSFIIGSLLLTSDPSPGRPVYGDSSYYLNPPYVIFSPLPNVLSFYPAFDLFLALSWMLFSIPCRLSVCLSALLLSAFCIRLLLNLANVFAIQTRRTSSKMARIGF